MAKSRREKASLEDVVDQLEIVSAKLDTLIGLFKLVNISRIEDVKARALKTEAKRKVYDSCDGTKTVKEIAEVVGASERLVYYHLSSLQSIGLISYRDERGTRFYYRILE